MTDRELYNFIKANYLPHQGKGYVFDLRNYHVDGVLNATLCKDLDEVQTKAQEIAKYDKYAAIYYYKSEIFFEFSYREFIQYENITKNEIMSFNEKREVDLEQLKKELKELVLFLNSQSS